MNEPQPVQQPPPIVAPPNRVNVTPQHKAGGGAAALARGGVEAGTSGTSTIAERLAEARSLFLRGRVGDARGMLESLLGAAPPAALHELGRTYDPYYLGMLPRVDRGSEPLRAAAFYREAILQGVAGAGADLDRLRASHQSMR